jgi:acyl-CoA thioesterase-1
MMLSLSRTNKILTLWVLWLLALPANSATMMVLGDSISAAYKIPLESGWVSLLDERLERLYPGKYKVINASISGDTSAGGLARLPPLLEQHNPNVVVVELGGNDGLRGLPLTALQSNLQAIINRCREKGAEVVLVGVSLPVSYGEHFNRLFRKVFVDVAATNELELVFLGFDLLRDRNLVQEDGIHPTAEAQPILLDALWPALAPAGT